MPDIPQKATFSVERDGIEYDVLVDRDLMARGIGPSNITDETMAGWLQDHLADLSAIAQAKIADLRPGDTSILIRAEDYPD